MSALTTSGPATARPDAEDRTAALVSDRAGGETPARERLIQHGLRLFAAQGFARTSVREIAEAAQVNVASIRYYFGDKAGLYRTVFFEPLDAARPPSTAPAGAPATLPGVIAALFHGLLAPLRQGERARLCLQLHFREMVEPTGLWEEEIEREIRPMHRLLVDALARHFALAEADPELERLALMITGLGVHLHVASDVIERLAPGLRVDAASVPVWTERLLQAAGALVDAEAARRGLAPAGPQALPGDRACAPDRPPRR